MLEFIIVGFSFGALLILALLYHELFFDWIEKHMPERKM